MSRPSILFINQHYWPDHLATSLQLTDLAEHLAEEGYDVTVWCSSPAGAGRDLARREMRRGVRIVRLRGPAGSRRSAVSRVVTYLAFYTQVVNRLVFGRRYDLTVMLTTPPLLATAAAVASTIRGLDYGIWSMDLHPDAEFALGMLRQDGVFGRAVGALSRWSERRASFVVALGACMRRRLSEHGIEQERLHTIPVWSRGDEIEPLPAEANPLREQLGLTGRFVVMYSGNAGLAHCFDELLEAMLLLREHDGITFLFVGDGPRRPEIETFIREHGLSNARYLDYLPRESLRYSLPLGDVHLITLRSEMAGIAVPSKLFGIMAAGRPVIMVGPPESEPARIIQQEKIGEVISPRSETAGGDLARAILRLYVDPEATTELGNRAREAFSLRYDRSVACERWSDLLRQQCGIPTSEVVTRKPDEAHV